MTPELSVNNRTLDEQHQELFLKTNELLQSLGRGQDQGIAKILSFLETHVITHFTVEEQLMKKRGYPHLAAHQAQHAQFIKNLNEFSRIYGNTASKANLSVL